MTYRIVDEPTPSAIERVTVNPVWPFFASMFAGSWLAWPWFVVNAFALGGSRRFGDLYIVVAGLLATLALVLALGQLLGTAVLSERSLPYALLVPQGLRVTLAYVLYLRQSSTFDLYQHFGGVAKSGLIVLIVGSLVRGKLLAQVPGLWVLLFV